MNESFERMQSLLTPLGICFGEESISEAEIAAYAAGIACVEADLDDAMKRIFFLLYPDGNPLAYARMLTLPAAVSGDRLYADMRAVLAHGFGDYRAADAADMFAQIGSGSLQYYDEDLPEAGVIPTIREVRIADIRALMRFVEAFTFAGVRFICKDSGMTFDEWEALQYHFNQLDSMGASFNILDKIRS